MIYAFIFILGLIFGSFYTVIGLRRPLNQSIVSPGSHCEYCNHQLKWYELIPVISYIFLGGKCKVCNSKISIIYPVIELLTGILFSLSYYLYGFSYEMIIMIILSSLLIIIYVSDFKYYVILDGPLIFFEILIIITIFIFLGLMPTIFSIVNALIMSVLMFLIKLFGDKVFKRESLGGGDIKLLFIVGLVLNFNLSLISLILSSFLALPYALYCIYKGKDEVPFGPFIITACLVVFIFSEPINKFFEFLYLI